ncbi:pin2-interacting protein x1 [Moniliophthora roreri]|nr:pin2-interacting protein x1 [Moniliophthora roreri]
MSWTKSPSEYIIGILKSFASSRSIVVVVVVIARRHRAKAGCTRRKRCGFSGRFRQFASDSMGVRKPDGVAAAVVAEDEGAEDTPRTSEIAAADLEAKLFAAICRAR